MKISLEDISIRTELKSGDLGRVVYLHGLLYKEEYDYGIDFESYVASGLSEFYKNYDPKKDRVWVCEHGNDMVGFLLLMHRENNSSQLRYFFILREFRGIGLGKKLMDLYMQFLKECGYQSSYLRTTAEQAAAAQLYRKYGFTLTEELLSGKFGKPVTEQQYKLVVS